MEEEIVCNGCGKRTVEFECCDECAELYCKSCIVVGKYGVLCKGCANGGDE